MHRRIVSVMHQSLSLPLSLLLSSLRDRDLDRDRPRDRLLLRCSSSRRSYFNTFSLLCFLDDLPLALCLCLCLLLLRCRLCLLPLPPGRSSGFMPADRNSSCTCKSSQCWFQNTPMGSGSCFFQEVFPHKPAERKRSPSALRACMARDMACSTV